MKKFYHFVLKSSLKDRIIEISTKLDRNLSDTVVFIFKKMEPLLERYFYNEIKDYRGDYQVFGADDDMYVDIKEENYFKLKHVTANMYIFSMAITMRRILTLFVWGYDTYGLKRFVSRLNRIKKIHDSHMAKTKEIKKIKMYQHMLKKYTPFDGKNRYEILFSNNLQILRFNFRPKSPNLPVFST